MCYSYLFSEFNNDILNKYLFKITDIKLVFICESLVNKNKAKQHLKQKYTVQKLCHIGQSNQWPEWFNFIENVKTLFINVHVNIRSYYGLFLFTFMN
jgi:hypothetical protein